MNNDTPKSLTALRIAACELLGWTEIYEGALGWCGINPAICSFAKLPNPTTSADNALALVGLLEKAGWLPSIDCATGAYVATVHQRDDPSEYVMAVAPTFALALTRAAVQVLRKENV